MVSRQCKRRYEDVKLTEEEKIGEQQCTIMSKESAENCILFHLLELPAHIICDIISRLPLRSILRCRLVCKMLLHLLKDPYFSNTYLTTAPTLTTNLILQDNIAKTGSLHFFTCHLSESTLSSCSSNDQSIRCSFSGELISVNKGNADFSFRTKRLALIGSCNGLLCMYFNSSSDPFYGICNPILGEFLKVPRLSAYADHSGFGYCLRMKQYKVVSFMYSPIDSSKMVAAVHTLGSDSWRRGTESAPSPKLKPFDPYLNGAIHWITTSSRPSELICSFNLERERFGFIPPPSHFDAPYVGKVSWINIGVLKGCLCVCSTYEDVEFAVWAMREYGVQESWTKEFRIDVKFYCRLQVEDLHRPVKLFSNGDVWFISSFNSLVSFSPWKRTFRELRSMGRWKNDVTAHDLSFLSIKNIAGISSSKVLNYRVGKERFHLAV